MECRTMYVTFLHTLMVDTLRFSFIQYSATLLQNLFGATTLGNVKILSPPTSCNLLVK